MEVQYNEWHKFALQIFSSKYNNVKLRTKKDYLKIINDFYWVFSWFKSWRIRIIYGT